MPSISVADASAPITADAVVVGLVTTPGGPRLADGAAPVDEALGGRLLDGLHALGARGRPGEVHKLATLGLAPFPLVVGVGLGPAATAATAEPARRAAGVALRGLGDSRRVHLAIDADPGALVEGALLGAYAFTAYKSHAPKRALRSVSVAAPVSARSTARAAVRTGTAVAQAVNLTRDLVNMPPNDLYPAAFALRAVALGEKSGLTVEVLDERALRRKGYGGLLGVGGGSARPPRLIRVEYRPARAKQHLALVGKGITFDSGGLNLKTQHLTWMKSDMGGAAAVLATVLAAAALKLPLRMTATLPMAENMISGSSYRPSDVLRLYDGTTVEVADTDAEGRLVLADAITRAMEDKPDRLLEISTLTGAQTTALGPRVIGAMGTDEWRDAVVRAGNAAGEQVWAMPLPSELRAVLDSPVADLVNVPEERVAGMLVAGHFLGEFVPDGLPWTHLDIAGPAWNSGAPRDYTPKGGTGAGVRTLLAAARDMSGLDPLPISNR